jgi:cystathionine beta-synthase
MFDGAVKDGALKVGDTIIEGTSGNTGVGLAMVAASKGYPCTIVMPEKMSDEKVNVLKGLGAKTIRTRTEARFFDEDSHIQTANRISREMGDKGMVMDQYNNDNNWNTHYKNTGQEIIDVVGDKLDYVVAGVGTGGTITGISKKVKETFPNCKVIGVDPVGSILADPANPDEQLAMPSYQVEGIGYDFVPYNCMREHIDEWVTFKFFFGKLLIFFIGQNSKIKLGQM